MRHTGRHMILVIVAFVPLGSGSACADFGPKMMSRVRVEATLDGRLLPDNTTAALLSPAPEAGSGPANAAAHVPELPIPYTDEAGQEWNYAGYLWGGRLQNGVVEFNGFQDFKFRETAPHGLPTTVRLAVYDPRTEQLYITVPASPGQHLALMRADLNTDGTGDLTSILVPFWQRLDFWKALLITLIVECVIVVWCVRARSETDEDHVATRPRRPLRLVRVCVLANLLTLPLVWFFGGEALFQLGFWLGTLAFLGLEVLAFLIEAVCYSGVLTAFTLAARLPWPMALRASLLANLTTFLLGFFL